MRICASATLDGEFIIHNAEFFSEWSGINNWGREKANKNITSCVFSYVWKPSHMLHLISYILQAYGRDPLDSPL